MTTSHIAHGRRFWGAAGEVFNAFAIALVWSVQAFINIVWFTPRIYRMITSRDPLTWEYPEFLGFSWLTLTALGTFLSITGLYAGDTRYLVWTLCIWFALSTVVAGVWHAMKAWIERQFGIDD